MRQPSQRDRELQRYTREYLETQENGQIDMDKLANSILESGKWEPDRKRIMRMIRDDLSHALSEERFTDDDGRRVREYHFVKTKKENRQLSLCFPIESISPKDMKISLQIRRNDIVSRAVQMNNDQSHFNKYRNNEEPIQTSFDLRNDVKEAEAERISAQKTASPNERSRLSSQSPDVLPGSACSHVPSRP